MRVDYDDEIYKDRGLKLKDLFSKVAQENLEEKLGNFSREQLDILWGIKPFTKNSYPSSLPSLDYKFIAKEIEPYVKRFISLYACKKPGALIRLLSECTGKSHKDAYHLLLYFDGEKYQKHYEDLRASAMNYSILKGMWNNDLWIFDVFNIIKDKEEIKKMAEEPFITRKEVEYLSREENPADFATESDEEDCPTLFDEGDKIDKHELFFDEG